MRNESLLYESWLNQGKMLSLQVSSRNHLSEANTCWPCFNFNSAIGLQYIPLSVKTQSLISDVRSIWMRVPVQVLLLGHVAFMFLVRCTDDQPLDLIHGLSFSRCLLHSLHVE